MILIETLAILKMKFENCGVHTISEDDLSKHAERVSHLDQYLAGIRFLSIRTFTVLTDQKLSFSILFFKASLTNFSVG